MPQTEREAKRFFVERILAQARAEDLRLSQVEQQMLRWSESDPDFKPDPALVDQLAAELSDHEYEDKITGLLERSYRQDVAASDGARGTYRQAYAVLEQRDHYLLVMIKRALAHRLRPWWAFWR
jgi:hypothetical protein